MGNYNINDLNRKELNCLDTTLTPYDLHVLNRTEPTKTKGASESLIDYIVTDLPKANVFETYFSDTLLRSKVMSYVGHRATSVISKLEMKTTRKSIVKEIFEKSNYHPDSFIQSVLMGNWDAFYAQNCGEGMYTNFVRNIAKALNHNISKKKFSSAMTKVAC